MDYKFHSRIVRIEHKQKSINWRLNANGQSECDFQDIGWFITMEGSHESLFIGREKPDLTVGQGMEVTLSPIG